MEYTALDPIEVSTRTDEKEFLEKYNMKDPVNEGTYYLCMFMPVARDVSMVRTNSLPHTASIRKFRREKLDNAIIEDGRKTNPPFEVTATGLTS